MAKVLLLNGSPHSKGNTYAALSEVGRMLTQEGVESEIAHIGAGHVRGCIACGGCSEKPRCVFGDDAVNAIIEKMERCDGLIVGSPVYYASANGALIAMLDRIFCAGDCFAHKPAAAVAVARRAGNTATIDELNKYFAFAQMPIVSSTYWNMVHGLAPGDAEQDAEGMQTMRNLARNMAWLIGCIKAGSAAGIMPPAAETEARTNFIR